MASADASCYDRRVGWAVRVAAGAMSTASISRQLAGECIDLAEATEDEERARTLFEACKTLMKAALREEGAVGEHREAVPG